MIRRASPRSSSIPFCSSVFFLFHSFSLHVVSTPVVSFCFCCMSKMISLAFSLALLAFGFLRLHHTMCSVTSMYDVFLSTISVVFILRMCYSLTHTVFTPSCAEEELLLLHFRFASGDRVCLRSLFFLSRIFRRSSCRSC
jgi:hypothetical protein